MKTQYKKEKNKTTIFLKKISCYEWKNITKTKQTFILQKKILFFFVKSIFKGIFFKKKSKNEKKK